MLLHVLEKKILSSSIRLSKIGHVNWGGGGVNRERGSYTVFAHISVFDSFESRFLC